MCNLVSVSLYIFYVLVEPKFKFLQFTLKHALNKNMNEINAEFRSTFLTFMA